MFIVVIDGGGVFRFCPFLPFVFYNFLAHTVVPSRDFLFSLTLKTPSPYCYSYANFGHEAMLSNTLPGKTVNRGKSSASACYTASSATSIARVNIL